jgi:hypothetical protein
VKEHPATDITVLVMLQVASESLVVSGADTSLGEMMVFTFNPRR